MSSRNNLFVASRAPHGHTKVRRTAYTLLAAVALVAAQAAVAGGDMQGSIDYLNQHGMTLDQNGQVSANIDAGAQQETVLPDAQNAEVVRKGGGPTSLSVGGFGDDNSSSKNHAAGTRTTTQTHTSSTTTTVAPPLPEVIKPCEIIDTCDKLDTLNMVSATQQKEAALKAQLALAKLKVELAEVRCKQKNACGGSQAAPNPLQMQKMFARQRALNAPDVRVQSITGRKGRMQAIVQTGNARFRVQKGDQIPGGGQVTQITPQIVEVNRNGRSYTLLSAGSAKAMKTASQSGRMQ